MLIRSYQVCSSFTTNLLCTEILNLEIFWWDLGKNCIKFTQLTIRLQPRTQQTSMLLIVLRKNLELTPNQMLTMWLEHQDSPVSMFFKDIATQEEMTLNLCVWCSSIFSRGLCLGMTHRAIFHQSKEEKKSWKKWRQSQFKSYALEFPSSFSPFCNIVGTWGMKIHQITIIWSDSSKKNWSNRAISTTIFLTGFCSRLS